MKKIFFALLALLLSCGSNNTANLSNAAKGAAASKATTSPEVTLRSILSTAETGNYREGELLVKFRSGVIAASSLRAHQSVGATRIRRFSMINAEHVKLPAGMSVRDAITRYMQDPDVEYAEPNYIRSIRSLTPSPVIPNDPLFGQQWALRNTGAGGGTPGADINATNAWDITTGSSTVVIAEIDTGIDYNHPDLTGNIWSNPGEANCTNGLDNDGNGFINDCRGWNFVANTNTPLDNSGHGSHVAGIIGAMGNDGIGVAGVMWHVQLMPLKILDSTGTGTIGNEVAAIDYAVMMKNRGTNIKAMNASFGGSDFSNIELSAISAANDAGILMMAAAGNGNKKGIGINDDLTPEYPANYNLPNIIAVAATDQTDNLASFSDFGPNSVHVAAPGVLILSTVVPGLPFPDCIASSVSGYDFCDGTSMSTPFVTGLAGLLAETYPEFTPAQIRGTILRYVDLLPSLQGKILTGGRINSFKAVSSLLAPTGLAAAANSAGTSVSLTWTDNATGEDGYTVERKIGAGAFTQMASLGPDSTSFTDTAASGGTTYTYRVTAFNTIPANSSGAEATVTTPAPNPTPTPTPGGSKSSSGGGGCTIGSRQNTASAAANTTVLFLPLLVLVLAKNIRRRKR